MSEEKSLNRQSILDGHIKLLAQSKPDSIRFMSDETRAEYIERTLSQLSPGEDVWVFAYGSLIWNPAIHFAQSAKCVVDGFHRSFCFWTVLGRGCEETPGLMMGLEPGGSSNGLAYRIATDDLASEIDILFRREMMSFIYHPTWVEAQSVDNPSEKLKVLAFVVDPHHERFCGGLDEATMVKHIATASGPFGRNCDYLFQLTLHLEQLGFRDDSMAALQKKVLAYQSEHC